VEDQPVPRRQREKKVIETPFDHVVVVGASLAGLSAVETLRREGYVGRITVIGAEPHMPYDRPPLSKQVLEGTAPPEMTSLRPPERFERLEAEWKLGRPATALDVQRQVVTLEGGEEVGYEAIVLATGATVRTLPNPAGLAGIHVIRTLDDCIRVRDELESNPKVAVIGAGFIGMEVAATCRKRGLDVDVVEALPVPLSHTFGAQVGSWCAELHEDNGVRIHTGVTVESFEGTDRIEAVKLADGIVIPAGVAVVGIGVFAETRWLEGSGLELDNGIMVDETCATRFPYVVAAGDVARWPNPLFGEVMRVEHWTNAIDMGAHAAKRLTRGEEVGAYEPVPYVWSDQYDVRIQFFGRVRPDDELHLLHGSVKERKLVALFAREGRLIGALGLNSPKLMGYGRLIGARASIEEAKQAIAH
jgi:NADPH-dependent 2,4-dienoyl-CoA reductase/sulfur reductase-like enzyme